VCYAILPYARRLKITGTLHTTTAEAGLRLVSVLMA